MGFSDYRHKYPFIRLLIPLAGGIYACELFSDAVGVMRLLSFVSLAISVLFFLFFYLIKKYAGRWLWGAAVIWLLFFLGIFITANRVERTLLKSPGGAHAFVAYVSEQPQEKPKSILCTLHVVEYVDSVGSHAVDHKVLLYLSKDSLSQKVCWGDKLLFCSKILQPRNNGNPQEFDYARYLSRRGVSGIAFASSDEWKWLSHEKTFDLRQKAFLCRKAIMDIYRYLGFVADNFSVLSALTIGYKDELSEEIRQAYSTSGVSHVLALSGLHIGLLYVLLDFLLGWANRYKGLRVTKQFFIILSLWTFAFIAGLSPSVVRSVSMFSLVAFSGLFGRRSVSLNTLAVAAFFMLLYNPFYLFDIGFQLSFLSVAGIVIIQPWLYHKLNIENRFLKYLWGMITVSIAAQIVTTPLVMYYFSSFPLHFLWANLLVIPLVTLALYIAVVMLLLGFFAPLQAFIASVLDGILDLLNILVSFVEHLPVSSIENIRFTQTDVLGFYLLIILSVSYWVHHRREVLVAILSFLFILSVFHLRETFACEIKPSILFYNSRSCPSVHFISSKDTSYLLSARKDSVIEKLKYAADRFWMMQRISVPLVLPPDYEDTGIYNYEGITCFAGKTVCLVNDDHWKNKVAKKPLLIDYLYVCGGYSGEIGSLTKLFVIRKVVLDSSLSDYRLALLKAECHRLGLDFISISEKGSYHIDL